jgi:lipid II isoglutaminyl synthase (glutamine-hydrolysing)
VRLRIAHLYPDVMNLYGDNGNLVVLAKRLAWRGHAAHVLPIGIGSRTDLRRADLIVGGGGSDAAQRQVAGDLLQRVDQIREAMADGVPMLVVCGMFQLFGHTYVPSDGHAIPGIGIFDATSTAASPRITGPITLRTPIGEVSGFENHGGVTRLGRDQAPFGQVLSGVGNGAGQAVEGARTGSVLGTYLHGPVLPANPALADHLLLTAMRRHDPSAELAPLGDHTRAPARGR